MINVGLKNPSIILMPMTMEEVEEQAKEFMGDERIYVLYKLPDKNEMQIGMMGSSVRKYSPGVANIWNLDKATTYAFFYNGASSLKKIALSVEDRPVYEIYPSDNRTVLGYNVLNNVYANLEDIVNGNVSFDDSEKKSCVSNKK